MQLTAAKTIRLLVIEDAMIDREILEHLLKHSSLKHLEIVHAESLSNALETLSESRFDVILLDLGLPDSGGMEAIHEIQNKVPQIPIIVLSGCEDDETATSAVQSGVQDYLIKGRIDSPLVMRSIRYAMERKRIEQELQKAEQQYRTIFENSAISIMLADEEGRLVSWNKSTELLLGMTPDDLLRCPLKSLYPKWEWQRIQLLHARNETRRHHLETQMIRKDQTVIDVAMSLTLIEGLPGKITGIVAVVRDITQRKRAEQMLRISETNLAKAQEVAHIGSWHLDIQDDTLVCSAEASRILGISEDTALSYASLLESSHPEDKALAQKAWDNALRGAVYNIQRRIVVNGEVKWVRERAELELNQNRQPVRAIGTTQDITERKQAEQALRENEEKFRSFVENASDIIFCMSIEKEFTYVSPNWPSILGHEVGEVLHQRPSYLLHPDDVAGFNSACEVLIETGKKVAGVEVRIEHKDGNWRWHMVSMSPLKDANGITTAIVGNSHDTTRRKKDQEELQRAQQEMHQMFSASMPLCVIGNDYNILMLNDTLCSLFDINIDEVADKKCYELMRTSKCHTTECPLKKVQEDVERYQYEITRTDAMANETACMCTATPYFSLDYSDVIGIVVNYVDITARKNAERATAEANQKLEEANRDLKEMQGQLVQNEKLASIGQLAAGVAHEMNTPVGFVASNFQTLKNYMNKFMQLFSMYEDLGKAVENGLKEERLEKMAAISETRQRMKIDFILGDIEELFNDSQEGLACVTGIIQNLRDFSRIDQPQDVGSYDLNDGLNATLIVARNEIKYDVELETDFGELPPITCHSGQLNQVFLNILVNAAQAIKSQNQGEKGHIRIRTFATEIHVVCEISDNGPGIPEEVLSRVFDPFFTTKPPGKGTGLGLSVSHDIIVNKHKGELSVDSVVGQGTKFTIKLPINSEPVENKQEQPEEAIDQVTCG